MLAATGDPACTYIGRWQLQRTLKRMWVGGQKAGQGSSMLDKILDATEDAAERRLTVTEDAGRYRGRCKGCWQLQRTLDVIEDAAEDAELWMLDGRCIAGCTER